MASLSSSESHLHILHFNFMAKGHTIPLLHLTRLLFLRRSNIAVTIFTHANSHFIRQSLHDTKIPQGVESVDKLPSQSLLVPFCKGTKFLQLEFDTILQSLRPNVSCLISDVFFPWSMEIAEKLSIPRLDFDGASNFAMVFYDIVMTREFPVQCELFSVRMILNLVYDDDELFSVIPSLPDIKLTKNDIEPEFSHPLPGEHADFYTEVVMAMSKSKGIIRNSFYELEPEFVDYWNRENSPKAWNIGPLCLLATKVASSKGKPMWIQWLDEKGKSVLYVAFGEMAIGLQNSGEHFLWVLRLPEPSNGDEFMSEFEERVKGRGLLVKNQWVDQVGILSHESVSHCGWNSVLESICESVPLLGFPLTADQHLNARMVEEYFRIGVKVVTRNGSVRGFFWFPPMLNTSLWVILIVRNHIVNQVRN
ncbi:hypothetical protein MKW92_022928 [Papaver armeniacum]|nr:hypothetical protein MKW92_022928 [Papaver armeniacum]